MKSDRSLFRAGEVVKLVEVKVAKAGTADPLNSRELFQHWQTQPGASAQEYSRVLRQLAQSGRIEKTAQGWQMLEAGREWLQLNPQAAPQPEKEPYTCPLCDAALLLRQGPYGPFYGCTNYPRCRFTRATALKVPCPKENCNGQVVERHSKNGKIFYGCSLYPACTFSSWLKPTKLLCSACGSATLVEKPDQQGRMQLYCRHCRQTFALESASNLTA